MSYTQDITRIFDAREDAVRSRYDSLLEESGRAVSVLRKAKESGSLPVLNAGEHEGDLPAIEEAARRIRENFATLVVVGMGGSSRGGRTLAALAENPYARAATQIHFLENIDPHTSDLLLSGIDFGTTLFLLISKSGDTAETLSHALILIHAVERKLGAKAVANHFIALTMPGENALRRIAAERRIPVLDHDAKIGGRFAALTNVGLLPAAVAGLDIGAIRKGAAGVVDRLFSDAAPEPAKGAAISVALAQEGRSVSVFLPYCDRLVPLSLWYQQLWAESLGKKGYGTTPLASLGATDQHSMLQLYLEGPRDKFVTCFLLSQTGKGSAIPATADKTLAYLNSHTLGDLMDAEQRATVETLAKNRVPTRVFTLEDAQEKTLGALLMHFMLETMIAAELLRINAFDQPAVEEGKILARQYLLAAQ